MPTPQQTADLRAAHRAKMAAKKARNVQPGFTPIKDRRFAPLRFKLRAENKPVLFNISTDARHGVARGSIAQGNRHTGKPHAHRREIARNGGAL